MTLLELFFPLATVALAVACYTCYKTHKPLREKARKEREEIAEKARKEASDKAALAAQEKIDKAVAEALRVLFVEARDYSHREEEHDRQRRRMGHNLGPQKKFPREAREVFHKVLRVGALEERMDNQEEGNKVRRKAINDLSQQVHEIRKVIDIYT